MKLWLHISCFPMISRGFKGKRKSLKGIYNKHKDKIAPLTALECRLWKLLCIFVFHLEFWEIVTSEKQSFTIYVVWNILLRGQLLSRLSRKDLCEYLGFLITSRSHRKQIRTNIKMSESLNHTHTPYLTVSLSLLHLLVLHLFLKKIRQILFSSTIKKTKDEMTPATMNLFCFREDNLRSSFLVVP